MKKLHALLIGIDEYAHISPLGGCKADIGKVDQYLSEVAQAGGFAYHPQTLFDQAATREGLVTAFEQHLVAQAGPGDVALIYFSGHGAQEEAGDLFPPEVEYDRKLEGWACHDTGTQPGHAPLLVDKELRYLLRRLAERGPDVIFISDSCHSGDNHRSAQFDDEPDVATVVRRTGITLPARPYEQFVFAQEIPEAAFRAQPLDEVLPQGRMVAISSCESWEFAYEKPGIGGVFTHYLLKTLRGTQGRISYHDLQSRVKALIKKELPNLSQVPRAAAVKGYEDDLFREFLSGALRERPLSANLTNLRHRIVEGHPDQSESLWRMDKGQIHGVQPSEEGQPDSLVSIALPHGKMAYGYVTQVETSHSEVRISPRESSIELIDPEQSYYGYLSGLMSQALYVHVTGEPDGVAGLMKLAEKHRAEMSKRQLFLRPNAEGCDYEVRAVLENGLPYWIITPPGNERPLVEQVRGWEEAAFEKLIGQLRQVQRWQFTHQLHNDRADALAQTDLAIEIHQNGQAVPVEQGLVALRYESGAGASSQGKFKIKLVNRSPQPLYVALLYLDTDFSANAGLLQPTVMKLEPQQEQWAIGGNEITMRMDRHILDFNWPATVYYLKALFSATLFTVEEFQQKGLLRAQFPWPNDRHRGAVSRGLSWGNEEEETPPLGTWQACLVKLEVPNPLFRASDAGMSVA